MKSPPALHPCPVCGFPELTEAPRTHSGGGSYEICPCCGYQFGVDDDDQRVSHQVHRARWIQSGLKWWSRGIAPPRDWDPQAQLASVAQKF